MPHGLTDTTATRYNQYYRQHHLPYDQQQGHLMGSMNGQSTLGNTSQPFSTPPVLNFDQRQGQLGSPLRGQSTGQGHFGQGGRASTLNHSIVLRGNPQTKPTFTILLHLRHMSSDPRLSSLNTWG